MRMYVRTVHFPPEIRISLATWIIDCSGRHLACRIGFLPTDRLLAYATGGLAYGQTHADSNFSITNSGSTVATAGSDGTTLNCGGGPIGTCMTGSDSRTSLGWVVGGGLEYGISNSVSLKAEYLYVGIPQPVSPHGRRTAVGNRQWPRVNSQLR